MIYLGWTKIAWVNLDQNLSGPCVLADFVDAISLPDNLAPNFGKCQFNKAAHGFGAPCRQHKIIAYLMVDDGVHALDIFSRMAPIALGVEIAEIELFLASCFNRSHRHGDFLGNESLTAQRAFMVEQNAV